MNQRTIVLILEKTQTPYINSWVFGPRLHGSLPQVNPNELTEIHLSPDIEHIASLHDILATQLYSQLCTFVNFQEVYMK